MDLILDKLKCVENQLNNKCTRQDHDEEVDSNDSVLKSSSIEQSAQDVATVLKGHKILGAPSEFADAKARFWISCNWFILCMYTKMHQCCLTHSNF